MRCASSRTWSRNLIPTTRQHPTADRRPGAPPAWSAPMSASPNGDRGRTVEQVEGVVQSANERGVHLQGEQDWRNYSRWADKPSESPGRGARVRLGLDGSGFVREFRVLGGAPSAGAPAANRERIITRLSVLRSAATFCGGYAQAREEVRSSDVLRIAEAWLKWVSEAE